MLAYPLFRGERACGIALHVQQSYTRVFGRIVRCCSAEMQFPIFSCGGRLQISKPRELRTFQINGIYKAQFHIVKVANLGLSQAFENTSTNVAASQMRNALNKLADTVEDPEEKKVRSLSIFHQATRRMLTLRSTSRRKWTTSLPSSDDT
jgi:hypothetical protein